MTKGDTVGELLLLRSYILKQGRRMWVCRCSCGETKDIRQDALLSGATRSCGHLQRDYARTGEAHRTHGMYGTPEWYTRKSMVRRCTEEGHKDYHNYGGRGLTVSARWLDFSNFLADMGAKPGPGYSIERLDNDRGYGKDNCIWATRAVQNRNTRANHFIEVDGRRMCLAEAAEVYGVNYGTLKSRLRRGKTASEAVQ